jgi:hypothetical protein
MQKMSMAAPLGGTVRDLGVPTTNTKNVDGRPLGGDAGDPGMLTINTKNVDGGPPWEATSEI